MKKIHLLSSMCLVITTTLLLIAVVNGDAIVDNNNHKTHSDNNYVDKYNNYNNYDNNVNVHSNVENDIDTNKEYSIQHSNLRKSRSSSTEDISTVLPNKGKDEKEDDDIYFEDDYYYNNSVVDDVLPPNDIDPDDEEDHDEIYPPSDEVTDDDQDDNEEDHDEIYPPNDDSPKSSNDKKEPSTPLIRFSQPHEYQQFKSNFNLRHDVVLELHDLNKNNNVIYVNDKYYSVDLDSDEFTPMDIYVDEGAEYNLDGIDQSEKLYSDSSSVYIRRQGSDAILVSRELREVETNLRKDNDKKKNSRQFEFTGEILTIDIMGENGDDFHLANVAPGILATVKAEDLDPDLEEGMKTLEMKGLTVSQGNDFDDNHNGNVIITKKNLTPDQLLANERYRRTTSESSIDTTTTDNHRHHRQLSSGCSTYLLESIAVVFDSTFCAQEGGHAQTKNKIDSIMSKSSLIYQRQGVCIKTKISVYEGHCSANFDPYSNALKTGNIGCNGVDGALQLFQNYWKVNRSAKPRAVAHFFFSKKFDETTIGCAYINVLCNKSYGYGANNMSYSKNTYLLGVLFSHELGHNNGLQHVASSHSNPFIMGSHVNSGENVWSSESIISLHTVVPSKSCIGKDTSGNTCSDTPTGWHDADGENYNCGWYALGSNCADYGNGWKHNGKNAAEACCACGGGSSSFYSSAGDETKEEEREEEKDGTTGSSSLSGITCGCSTTCTSSILGTVVDDKSIEERISWVVDNLNESEEEACELVCGEEFDDICGSECNPSQCKNN